MGLITNLIWHKLRVEIEMNCVESLMGNVCMKSENSFKKIA